MSEPQPEHRPVSHWGFDDTDLDLSIAPSRGPSEVVEETKRLAGFEVPRRRHCPRLR